LFFRLSLPALYEDPLISSKLATNLQDLEVDRIKRQPVDMNDHMPRDHRQPS
jgi:hypothetical protein